MADSSQKVPRAADNTAGAPQAENQQAMQGVVRSPHSRQPAQGMPRAQSVNNAAQGNPVAAPKYAPQQRTLQGSVGAPPQTAQTNNTRQQSVGAAPTGQTGAKRAAAPAQGASSRPVAGAQAAKSAQPTQPTRKAASAQGAGQPAQAPRNTKRQAAPQGAPRETRAAALAQVPAKQPETKLAASKERPRKHENAQGETPRATRNTISLHSTAILQLEQIARNLQRGVNDGALVEAEEADRLPFRLVINALGQMLYRIGQQSEYVLLRIWRTLCRAAHLLTAGVLLLLRTFLRPIGALAVGIWHDISFPFVRLFVGIGNMFRVMREAKAHGESAFSSGAAYAKQGIKAYRHLGVTALSYVLPLMAAAVLAITVWSVLNTPFSLAVTYNERMIGYVENESVWESAKKKVTDRIRAASPDETFDARPSFNVVSVQVAARRDVLEMVDLIISESSDQIQNATGLYVGDTLAGVCNDGQSVQQMLDTTLTAARPAEDPTARVQFVNAVTSERGLYFTDSISTLTQLESTLQANNWLQVKLIRTEVHNDPIEFEIVEEENASAYKGTTRVKQRGKNGEKVVTDDVAYISDVEVERVTLSEQIIKEAVPQIVTVGTKEMGTMGSYNGAVIQGSGALMWPVPNYIYTTTEFGGHRGLDICAPYGSPVHACDSGTVIEAGWHWSWGYYVLIDHGNGVTTRYAHNSSMAVVPSQNVAKGEVIAYVGSTGSSSGNHCHLEVTVNGGLVNPRRYLSNP